MFVYYARSLKNEKEHTVNKKRVTNYKGQEESEIKKVLIKGRERNVCGGLP